MTQLRDSIDFASMNIPKLFTKLFIPTLLGMLFSATLNIADGIFVGQGCGSVALAAVNIAAPIFLLTMGVSLLFGTGVSIVGAIHLSKCNFKAANINVTQAFILSLAFMTILSITIFSIPKSLCYLFGGSHELEPYVVEYLRCVSPLPVLMCTAVVGMFIIRLDGSPNYAMYVNIIPALLNILLDWYFIFPLNMGLAGAAIATSISEAVAFGMVIFYMLKKAKTLHVYSLKISKTSLRLTYRNFLYMLRVGFPTFIGEAALSCMMIVGNYMFMLFLEEEGVAAYSIACYLFPLIFMFANSIAQSALPIISFNYGKKAFERIKMTFSLSVKLSLICGIALTIMMIVFGDALVSVFISEDNRKAYDIATSGLSYFSLGFTFFSLNIVCIGYFQSLEKSNTAIFLMILRGIVFVVPSFIILPYIIGAKGLWLAVPLSEVMTFIVTLVFLKKNF